MTSELRSLVDGYTAATAAFLDVAAAVPAARLDAGGADGGWTPRAVIHHMADSETRAAVRLRQLLAVVAAVRAATAELLGCLGGDALARAGTHTESGPYSVRTWLENYTAHPHEHAAQIAAAAWPGPAG